MGDHDNTIVAPGVWRTDYAGGYRLRGTKGAQLSSGLVPASVFSDGAARESAKAADDQEQLRKLLVDIVGEGNNGISKAHADLLFAISWYKSTPQARIADTREYLDHLERELRIVRTLIIDIPIGAVNFFFSAYARPKGTLTRELDKAIKVAQDALKAARDHPDRKKRISPDVLACNVAVAMRDVLDVTPTATRDTDENVKGTRGGARYARLLRGVLALAESDIRSSPRKDIGWLIDKGLRMLKDPSMPHNPPRKRRQ